MQALKFFPDGHVDQSLLNLRTKFLGKNHAYEKTIYLEMNNLSSSVININAIKVACVVKINFFFSYKMILI